jgi:Mg2+ and Co2+ transporter CorA
MLLVLFVCASLIYIVLDDRTDTLVREIKVLEKKRSELAQILLQQQYKSRGLVDKSCQRTENFTIHDFSLGKEFAPDTLLPKVNSSTAEQEVTLLIAQKRTLSEEIAKLSQIRSIEKQYAETLMREFNDKYGSSNLYNTLASFTLGVISSLTASLFWQKLQVYRRMKKRRRSVASP